MRKIGSLNKETGLLRRGWQCAAAHAKSDVLPFALAVLHKVQLEGLRQTAQLHRRQRGQIQNLVTAQALSSGFSRRAADSAEARHVVRGTCRPSRRLQVHVTAEIVGRQWPSAGRPSSKTQTHCQKRFLSASSAKSRAATGFGRSRYGLLAIAAHRANLACGPNLGCPAYSTCFGTRGGSTTPSLGRVRTRNTGPGYIAGTTPIMICIIKAPSKGTATSVTGLFKPDTDQVVEGLFLRDVFELWFYSPQGQAWGYSSTTRHIRWASKGQPTTLRASPTAQLTPKWFFKNWEISKNIFQIIKKQQSMPIINKYFTNICH